MINSEKLNKKRRNKTIDTIRGVAFFLMIIHHVYYFRIFTFLPYKIPKWVEMCGIISRNTFIILNGFVSAKYNSKYGSIFINALIISFFSYSFLPNQNVIYMGVLHYLFLSSFILRLIKQFPKIILLLGYMSYKYRNYAFLIKNNPADIFMPHSWFYKSMIGYILGRCLFYIPNFNFGPLNINKLGEHSLALYTIHMCLFMLIQNRF